MSKKTAARAGNTTGSSESGLDQILANTTVCLAGRIRYPHRLEQLTRFVARRGGRVVDVVTDDLGYLVLGETATAAFKNKAEALNRRGVAKIQILELDEFERLVNPTAAEILPMLTAGSDGTSRALTLIKEMSTKLDLRGVDLRQLQLPTPSADEEALDLSLLDVQEADLRGVMLDRTEFESLEGARLDGASLCHSHVSFAERASLKNANLQCASGFVKVAEADFSGADLRHSELHFHGHGVKLVRANLEGAIVRFVGLQEADFTAAKATDADFTRGAISKSNFARANLRGAKLTLAKLQNSDFSGADLRDADLTGADLSGANLTGAKLKGSSWQLAKFDAAAVDRSADLKSSEIIEANRFGPKLEAFRKVVKRAAQIQFELKFQRIGSLITVKGSFDMWNKVTWEEPGEGQGTSTTFEIEADDPAVMLLSLGHRFRDAQWQFDDVAVKSVKSRVSGNDLKSLVVEAVCEAFATEPPTEEAVKAQQKSRQSSEAEFRQQMLAQLKSGAAGIKRWNELTDSGREGVGHLRDADFSKAKLASVNFRRLDLRRARFERANLREANLYDAKLQNACLAQARLDRAEASRCNLTEADLSKASLKKTCLSFGILRGARFCDADLTGASFLGADVRGADFATANLSKVDWNQAKHDEATRWPASFDQYADLVWAGTGPNPAHAHVQKQRAAGGPIDLPTFLKRLEEETDAGKLDKALSMLKADRFRLFAEVQADSVIGIVKSQGDPDLVYSCRLDATGKYACCTQNLNICGGLRGSLCKHLLVLIVGLTQAGQLDPTQTDLWIAASKLQKPELDKELMSETFLRYKGAEAGEVDWRPTETLPEDYYAV
jgi:uncharacterized protein YjbI with pentapeptide repeats